MRQGMAQFDVTHFYAGIGSFLTSTWVDQKVPKLIAVLLKVYTIYKENYR